MAILLGEFIHNLAKKAGIPEDNEDFKNFISADYFTKTEVPETISEQIDNSLISLKDASNNHPTIKNAYHSQVLDRIDKNIFERAAAYGLSDDMISELKAEKSSYKRMELFEKRIQEVAEKRSTGDDKTVRAQMQKQIDEAQAKLRQLTENEEKIRADFANADKERKKEFTLNEILGEYKTEFDKLPKSVRNKTLRDLIADKLKAKNAKLDFDEHDNFVLKQIDGDSNYYGDNNQQWDPKKFIDFVFAENKVLSINPAPGSDNPGGQTSGRVPPSGNGVTSPVSGTFSSLLNNARNGIAANQ